MAVSGMSFEDALHEVKLGERVYRSGWNGKNMYVQMHGPDSGATVNLPYLCLVYKPCATYPMGAQVPWLPSQTDLLINDWCLVRKGEQDD